MQTWLDFSAYGLKFMLLKSSNGYFLALNGESASAHHDAAKALRLKPHKTNPNLYYRTVSVAPDGSLAPIDRISFETYQRHFPNITEIPYSESEHFKDISNTVKPTPTIRAADRDVMKGNTRRLGVNKIGQEIFEAENGRFAKNERGQLIAESESVDINPGLYLRAPNADALAICAEGLCEEVFRNNVFRSRDFENFIANIYPEPVTVGSDRYLAARRAVEAASARVLVRKVKSGLSQAYVQAVKLNENLAFLGDGKNERFATPTPMAIAAQRLLGTEANLKNSRIAVLNPGFGNFLTHLPRSADLHLMGDVPSEEVGALLRTTGMKAKIIGDADERVACDAQIANLSYLRGPAQKTSAGSLTRLDLDQVLSLLSRREADGNTAVILDAPRNPQEANEFTAVQDYLAQRYSFDGESRLPGSLWHGRVDAGDKIMWSIGWRRPKPVETALPPVPREMQNWGDLWAWTAEVVSSRAQLEREDDVNRDVVVKFNTGSGETARNTFQVPYVSASKLGTPTTMIPRNLEGAMREALANIVRIHGDVDAWVAREYDYSVEEMREIFSPEQIDSLALHVHAENRGRGFLIADQMGIGKGRQLAAIIRRATLKGQKVVFLTEKQTNLSDIIRDLSHTKSLHLVKPMIINDNVSIISEKTRAVIMRSTPREEVETMIESGRWPHDYNLVIGTYSQFANEITATKDSSPDETRNPDGKAEGVKTLKADEKDRAAKARWLTKAVDKDTKMVIDECHNAASGTSNISRNLTHAVHQAGSVTFSSATFAHKAKHMAFYAPLLPDGLSTQELGQMLEKGGETFQEVLSGMLVHDGVMVRREFDLSNITFQTLLDTAHQARNRAYMDSIAPILSEMVSLSTDVGAHIEAANQNVARRRARVDEAPEGVARLAGPAQPRERRGRFHGDTFSRVGSGASLYSISRLFVAALKVDIAVETALESLQNNRKPVFLVENTVQSLLEEIAETEENADVETLAVPDFRVLFHKALRQITTVRVREPDAKASVRRDVSAASPEIRSKVERIRAMIENIPSLPVSAIDEVKRRITEAGWTCGEITGRTMEVRNGRVVRRSVPNTTVVKNAFNSGELDAVIINTAGATGIDLHASRRFEDQRQRHLIELQAPSDVLRKVQAHGRVNRFDQVHHPIVTSLLTGLPVEMRLAAMENAHLRRLSANTTSNRDTAALTRDIPDLINPIGDVVCARYAEAHPDLMRKLGLKVVDVQEHVKANQQADADVATDLKRTVSRHKSKDDIGATPSVVVADVNRTANEILSRLIMLPVTVQERVCQELIAEFHAAIEEMEARGETPLKTHELPGLVHVKRDAAGRIIRAAFDGADVEQPDSIFHEPLFIADAALERMATPIKTDTLLEMIAIGEMASGRSQQCIDKLRAGMNDILTTYLPDGFLTVAEALERNYKPIVDRKERLEKLVATLERLKPGSEIHYTVDEQIVKGIVTKIDYADRGMEHVPGLYGVEFAVPGDEKPRTMRMETFLRDANFMIDEGLGAENYDAILKDFENKGAIKLTSVKLLVGNLYRGMKMAVEHGLGSLRVFKMADGTVHRGIVISKRYHDLNSVPVEIVSPAMALAALASRAELTADSRLIDKQIYLTEMPDGDREVVEFRLPPPGSRKYGYIYDDQNLAYLLRRNIASGKTQPSVRISKSEAAEALGALYNVGVRLWCNSRHRKWANEWLARNQGKIGKTVTVDEPVSEVTI